MTPRATKQYALGKRSESAKNVFSIPVLSSEKSGVSMPLTNGIVRGAAVVTTSGLCAVQDLREGDRLISRNSGVVPVYRIESQSVVARAVYVLAGSIGHHQLKRDTLMPQGQNVLVRDWRAKAFGDHSEMITYAGALIDGEFWRDIGWHPMTVYRIYCKKPQVIYADGMEMVTADSMTCLDQHVRS